MLRTELQLAEGELKDRCWAPPLGLQQWLQLTHEIENKAYNKKKIAAEKQLQQAREAVSINIKYVGVKNKFSTKMQLIAPFN